jgi:hypothetical protein
VYGKRATSSLHALRETLLRREQHVDEPSEAEAVSLADPYDEDEASSDEAPGRARGLARGTTPPIQRGRVHDRSLRVAGAPELARPAPDARAFGRN